jgi:hypothetical protein
MQTSVRVAEIRTENTSPDRYAISTRSVRVFMEVYRKHPLSTGSLVTTAWRVLRLRMLTGSLVTTPWRVLRLRMEDTASEHGGWLLTRDCPPARGLGVGLTPPRRKK